MWGCPLTYDWGLGLIPSPTTCPQTEPWVWGCPITKVELKCLELSKLMEEQG